MAEGKAYVLKGANVLVYLFLLGTTITSVFGPKADPDIVASHQTYITPAIWSTYVWSVIHLLLGGFVIYQFFDQAHEQAVHGVGWHFVISAILNAAWFWLWTRGHEIISFFAILITASSVGFVFCKAIDHLEHKYPAATWADTILVHAPFSLWHGGITVLTVINLFAIFQNVKPSGPSTLQVILVVLGLVFLASTAIGYVEYKHRRGDLVGSFVISFALFAIWDNQTEPVIRWTAFALAILTALYPARPWIFSGRLGGSREEQAPLLG